ncbi:hypothetical protein ACFUIW_13860 [Streptomyces sp. NPDC057245]|uniref:hypothetical protein n=1 Tax=Streptomyces TaxID=1883 RepID=UPI001C1DE5EB|nr:hypothetical protein [Streptomyces sp. A108]MBU6536364.1 hypothetical protein [Streptomyces sp. A108]
MSTPMPIPGATNRSGSGAGRQSSSSPSDTEPYSEASLPGGVQLHVHLTDPLNGPYIAADGLLPGGPNGINMAGEPDTRNIYVLTGELRETNDLITGYFPWGAEAVGVLSAAHPRHDENFPNGGSASYDSAAPPIRAFSSHRGGSGPYSFTLPITRESARGIASFVNFHRGHGQARLTEREVVNRVRGELSRNFNVQTSTSSHSHSRMPSNVADYLPQRRASASSGSSASQSHRHRGDRPQRNRGRR